MAKTKISEFSTNPANNTDINGINIAEGCAPSGINNAIRSLMSDLKEFQTGAAGDDLTVGGNLMVTGSATLSADPISSLQAATKRYVDNSTPSGAITMWPTAAPPSGWLLCNGGAVSRTTFAALFAVVGTTFGAGDGTTTFNLPDYRDRMPIGSNTIAAVGVAGGSKDAIVVSHTHTATSSVTDPGHSHSINMGANFNAAYSFIQPTVNNLGFTLPTNNATTGISVNTTVNSTGSSGTNANLPPYLGINFIIKA